jgi:excisionase family DNA binding protein
MSSCLTPREPDVVSIAEAAKSLSVSQSTVRRLLKCGELDLVRIGRVVRIPRKSILALLDRSGGAHVS